MRQVGLSTRQCLVICAHCYLTNPKNLMMRRAGPIQDNSIQCGCICLTFLHCAFSNEFSNCSQIQRKASHQCSLLPSPIQDSSQPPSSIFLFSSRVLSRQFWTCKDVYFACGLLSVSDKSNLREIWLRSPFIAHRQWYCPSSHWDVSRMFHWMKNYLCCTQWCPGV